MNKLSQADLAERVGVSQPAIANWEAGVHDPRRVVLARLADVLDTPLEWLAAGARSSTESDRRPAAAYLRRSIHHVPVIRFQDAAHFAFDDSADPNLLAEDYIPTSAASPNLFAVLTIDNDMDRVFPRNTIAVIDYSDRTLAPGAFYLVHHAPTPLLRKWNEDRRRFEVFSSSRNPSWPELSDSAPIIGRVLLSIRIH